MKSRPSYQITRHPIGSLSEIWSISWPLIFGLISNGLMIVVDRLMLGHYSLEAMNAATTSGSAAFSIFILPMIVAGISEVFVGRFHGLQMEEKMGSAVWQMIWFALFMTPLFIIAGYISGPYLFKNILRPDLAGQYFYTIVNFGSIFCIVPALMGFFIGQGKVRIITITVALANLLNFGLGYALIFGTPINKAYGVSGAAVATVIAQACLALVFFSVFLNASNRKNKGTFNWKLKWPLLMQSLKIGVPASFAHVSEYVSYFFFLKLMNNLGPSYLTIAVLLNTIYMIVYFIIEGMSKGVMAINSNLLGAGQQGYVRKSLWAACKLHFIFVTVVSMILLFGAPGIYSIFIGPNDQALLSDPAFLTRMTVATTYMCLFYLFDGIIWSFIGVLTAASDTKFIMFIGSLAPWALFLAPIYFGSKWYTLSTDQIWMIAAIYSFIHMCVYLLRYKSGAWKKERVDQDPSLLIGEEA